MKLLLAFLLLFYSVEAVEVTEGRTDRTLNVTTTINSTVLLTGSLILGGLLLFSAALYALDVYATSRIDNLLLDFYGPKIYEKYTGSYNTIQSDLTATTQDDYYGNSRRRRQAQEDQTTGMIMGWINLAYDIYNAADESLKKPECRKKLVCEVYRRPDEVLDSGYLSQTIQKGIEDYLPLIQEKSIVAADILEGKKEAEENGSCQNARATCSHLHKVMEEFKFPTVEQES